MSGREMLTSCPTAQHMATLLSVRALAVLSAVVGCAGRCERVWGGVNGLHAGSG